MHALINWQVNDTCKTYTCEIPLHKNLYYIWLLAQDLNRYILNNYTKSNTITAGKSCVLQISWRV